MRILFAMYPKFVAWNHGIALLSQLCKHAGIETGLVMLDEIEATARAFQDPWDYIGFSATTVHDYRVMVPALKFAKEKGHKTLLGGTYVKKGVQNSYADQICHGEGENLPLFLLEIDASLFWHNQVWPDLDDLPLPDYDLFSDYPFVRNVSILDGKKVLPYHSSRGCPYYCTFCEIRHQREPIRIRRKAEEDLRELKDRYGPEVFYIGDALIPYYDPGWMDSWGDFRHPFVCYIRADIKPSQLQWLIDRGMIGCAFGVESGDESIRNAVLHKDLDNHEIQRTVDILKRHGVHYSAFFMTGFPDETFESRKLTFDLAAKIGMNSVIYQYEDLRLEN